jgi:RNA polymerase sigma-70 factor (ECF subfamily)
VDETQYLNQLKAGDEGARQRLYLDYRERLYATACHILGYRDAEAEDAVHDTFAAALAGIKGFEGRASLYTWLTHICVNLCFAAIRKRKRMLALEEEAWERAAGRASLQAAREGEDEALRLERLASLGRWLKEMGGRCQELLQLRLLERLGLSEIRERLKLPLGTVAARLWRCQKTLKELAKKELEEA